MRKYWFLLLVTGLFLKDAFAQKDTALYYLDKTNRVVSTKDSADLFLMILPPDTSIDKGLFVVKEYYPTGKLRLISGSVSKELEPSGPAFLRMYKPFLQGNTIFYFMNGHKMRICTYDNGQLTGDETDYYPNGKFYCVKHNAPNNKVTYNDCRDSTGKVLAEAGNGQWLMFNGESFRDYTEGMVRNGLPEGEWHEMQNDSIHVIQQYKNGEMKTSATMGKSGELTYMMLEKVPEFPGGLNELAKFLGRNIVYPDEARRNNTHGRIFISFVVGPDGKLSEFKVYRGIGSGCDEEALRVLKKSSPWKPGLVDGKPVRVAYTVPINFSLSN